MLLFVLAIIIVLLAVSGAPGGLGGLWDRVTGHTPSEPDAQEVTSSQPMTTQDGLRHVDQAQRDMAMIDSLAGSVRAPR